MPVTRLEVVEYEVEEGDEPHEYPAGHKYSYFIDPVTGKHYRPKANFVITGDDLESNFEEVIYEEPE